MKILSCFSRYEEIKPLAAAGADELYCAVPGMPSFGEPASLEGAPDLRAVVNSIHRLGLKLSLAVNSQEEAGFTLEGEKALLRQLAAADAAGVDSFIVANPAILELLLKLRRRRARLHLSTVQPCFNSLAAEFFLDMGISRLILPNQLSPYEARGILELCRKRKVETEIFDYRFYGCAYINGRCHLHRPDYYSLSGAPVKNGSMCRMNLSAGKMAAPVALGLDPSWRPRLGAIAGRLSSRLACGGAPRMYNFSTFFDFFSAGVGYLKYGTRQDTCAVKVAKVKELRAMLTLAGELSAKYSGRAAKSRFMRSMEKWDGCRF